MSNPEFEKWYQEALKKKLQQEPNLEQGQSMHEYLEVWLATHTEELRKQKLEQERLERKARRKQALKDLFLAAVGTVCGFATWQISYSLIQAFVLFVGRFSLLAPIMYPSGIDWTVLVLPGTTSAAFACFICSTIAKTSKPISVIIVITHAILLFFVIRSGGPVLSTAVEALTSSVAALLFWNFSGTD